MSRTITTKTNGFTVNPGLKTMTKAEIKKQLSERVKILKERIVDIYITEYDVIEVITISKNHCVWKHYYEIIDNVLQLLDVDLLG